VAVPTVAELIANGKPCFSFEFFPPRDADGVEALLATMLDLRDLEPSFVSVTYGAGGSTRARTLEVVQRLQTEVGITAMAHLSCVGASNEEIRDVLESLGAAGVRNVLALRGDPPQGETSFTPSADGLGHASDLVALIQGDGDDWCVGGACHPEGHLEAPDLATDLVFLRRKVDAGAQFLVTQLFFDNAAYFTFVERARAAGIMVPIVPGVMPVTNVDQIERFTRLCGARLPDGLLAALHRCRDDPQAVLDLGVAYATLQCAELLRRGAPGVHFYTLNRSPATRAILRALRLHEPWRVT